MSMTLTSGRESRMEGAPPLPDPEKEARTRAVAIHLLNQFGEPVTEESLRAIMPEAAQLAERYTSPQFEADAINRNRTRLYDAAVRGYESGSARAQERQDARGVFPEDLPADEYGSVSARTVRDANMSPEDQEASLNQFQGLVDAEIRDIREGRFHGANAQARQYEQDYGLPTNPSKTGKTDLDYLREIQQHQGFLRTGRGEMIPMGPAPTPEAIESRRDFDEWSNETPGSERQALYDPASYEKFREEARNRIRERAQQDMATFGTGVSDPAARKDLGLAPLTPDQEAARAARSRSEARVREAQMGRFADERRRADAGLPAAELGENPTAEQMEAAAFRRRLDARQASKDRRQALVAQRGVLRGAGLSPAVGDMRNRFDELIERLGQENMTDWQRAGIIAGLTPNAQTANPTPLGRDAVGAQNAMRWFTADALAGNLPGAGDARRAAVDAAVAQLPLNVRADRERDANDGVLPANSAAGQDVLADIAARVVGSSYATNAEVRLAIDRAKAEGIPEQDAIDYFRRHSQFANSGFWGYLLGPNDFEGPSAAPAPPAAPPPPGRQGDVGFR